MKENQNVLKALVAPFHPEASKILSQFPSRDGYLLKLFRMWANSPRHLQKFASSSLLDKDSPITMKHREIVILRTTALNQCEYEWGVHVSIFAQQVGLTRDQIGNTLAIKVDPSLWTTQELLLLDTVDTLMKYSLLSEEVKRKFQKMFSVEEQLEIFALCGFYTTVAFTANNSEIGLEPFGATFSEYKTEVKATE